MATSNDSFQQIADREYEHGFVTDIAADALPPGLNEDIIRAISARKGEPAFMLDWRLKAYAHWRTLKEPSWQKVKYDRPDYDAIVYYSAMGTDEEKAATAAGLARATPRIQAALGEETRLRYTPKLEFRVDPSIDEGLRISQILSEIAAEDDMDVDESQGDSEEPGRGD